jgi:FkbM family methyltransferase
MSTQAYLAARARLATAAVMWGARWTPYVEPEMLGLSDLVGEGSVCVDVGSAAGLYTLALSRLAGPSGQVHSVEPLAFAHPACTRLLRARGSANVQHHAVALGAAPGSALMSVPVRRGSLVTGRSFLAWPRCGLGANEEFDGHVCVAVEVETLDNLCERTGTERLNFLKIDVEGGELQVLRGGESAITRWLPALLVEIEARHAARYGNTPEDTVRWLAERGYTMFAWQGRWRRAGRVSADRRNYLFRHLGAPVVRGLATERPRAA